MRGQVHIADVAARHPKTFSTQFVNYLISNPDVFDEFDYRAMQQARRGVYHASAKDILIEMREESKREVKDWKISNNLFGQFARLFHLLHPTLDGFFDVDKPIKK